MMTVQNSVYIYISAKPFFAKSPRRSSSLRMCIMYDINENGIFINDLNLTGQKKQNISLNGEAKSGRTR